MHPDSREPTTLWWRSKCIWCIIYKSTLCQCIGHWKLKIFILKGKVNTSCIFFSFKSIGLYFFNESWFVYVSFYVQFNKHVLLYVHKQVLLKPQHTGFLTQPWQKHTQYSLISTQKTRPFCLEQCYPIERSVMMGIFHVCANKGTRDCWGHELPRRNWYLIL